MLLTTNTSSNAPSNLIFQAILTGDAMIEKNKTPCKFVEMPGIQITVESPAERLLLSILQELQAIHGLIEEQNQDKLEPKRSREPEKEEFRGKRKKKK